MLIAELLTIGNEILDGRVTDTNRVYLGRKLKELGFELRYAQSVDDDLPRIVAALELAATRSDFIFCTGGLGPTSDDLTAEAVAKFLQCEWALHAKAETVLRDLLFARGRDVNLSQLKQAKLPVLCEMIPNPVGSAPGFFYQGTLENKKSKELSFYFYPGVPQEMYVMFEESFMKPFASKSLAGLRTYTWSTLFTVESEVQESLKKVDTQLAPFKLGYRTHFPENHISLMGQVSSAEDEVLWDRAKAQVSTVLSSLSFHEGKEELYEKLLLQHLEKNQARLILVESCTGGLISHLLTDVPGSSRVLWGSHVCYANEEKIHLGVNPETLKSVGAVSAECALQMAECGLKNLEKDVITDQKFLYSLSTTGIAGPGGATDRKPVGLMYVALAVKNLTTGVVKITSAKIESPRHFERKAMKLYMAKKALEFLRLNGT